MKFKKNEVPLTATHYSKKSSEFLRWGKNGYAEVYLNNKYWYECPTLKNFELTTDNYNTVSYDYVFLNKTSIARLVCNIRLSLIKFKYRV